MQNLHFVHDQLKLVAAELDSLRTNLGQTYAVSANILLHELRDAGNPEESARDVVKRIRELQQETRANTIKLGTALDEMSRIVNRCVTW